VAYNITLPNCPSRNVVNTDDRKVAVRWDGDAGGHEPTAGFIYTDGSLMVRAPGSK